MTQMASTTGTPSPFKGDDDGYEVFSNALRIRFADMSTDEALFTTDAEGLFEAFLGALPADRRQHYNCHACRRFVDTFGGLVTIDPQGGQHPALWPLAVPPCFQASVDAVRRLVGRATVNGVFLSSAETLGLSENESKKPPYRWRHMHVCQPRARIFRHAILSASQRAAELREDRGTLLRGLAEHPVEAVREAWRLLTSGQLYRSEKAEGAAAWLMNVHEERARATGKRERENLAWRAVASAPAGYTHPRTTVIGTLLEDIQAGLPFADIKRKWDDKLHPLAYRRPTTVSEGNLDQAEAVVAKLGIAASLRRRFARLEEVTPHALWVPRAETKAEAPTIGGLVFDHLRGKAGGKTKIEPRALPATNITWEKFAATVLPGAERLEYFTVSPGPYFALITAADPEAPPILQWDSLERRNPFSWYCYVDRLRGNGSPPERWNLTRGAWVPVEAVAPRPSRWFGETKFAHHGDAIYMVLRGARDTAYDKGGAFFPEDLRGELHAVRHALEAYAREAVIEGKDDATACGVVLGKGGSWNNVRVRVTNGQDVREFNLDRWE